MNVNQWASAIDQFWSPTPEDPTILLSLEPGLLTDIASTVGVSFPSPADAERSFLTAVRAYLNGLRRPWYAEPLAKNQPPRFLLLIAAQVYAVSRMDDTGKRTTNLASTNSTKVGLFPIPLPKLAIQEAICRFLDDKLAEVKSITNGIEAQIATLIAYRKSLIHECVTGQRRISEEDLARVKSHA